MKKIIFILMLLLLSSQLAHSQFGRNGYLGRQRTAIPRGPEPEPKKPEPKTAEEMVEEEMPKLTEALELNDFEQAVVSSILTKYLKQRIELQILELPADKMRESLEKISINQSKELEEGLPVEKYEAFVDLQENGYNSKKNKKKKKKKKKT
ncbi:hypothetical protein [Robiginitalea sp. IMCC43444]|uniref:hypothetical protein n=1 Tax=Robiginitalea sp. IMCC43444 TaxID=3459121 RepID=UPI0040425A3D